MTATATASPAAVPTMHVRYEHDQDFAYWQAKKPDLTKLAERFRPKWESTLGDPIVLSKGGATLSSRGHVSIGPDGMPGPHTTNDQYFNEAPTYSNCVGRAENMTVLDQWLLKEGQNVTLTVVFEGDIFWGTASGQMTCSGFRHDGKKFTQTTYVWRNDQWVDLTTALADKDFQDTALKPDTLAIGIEENRKFEEKLRLEREEKEKRHDRYREMRTNQNRSY